MWSAPALDLGAALGTGDDDLALSGGYPADGPAALAGEILVVLVGVALLGAAAAALEFPAHLHPAAVLLSALIEVFGKHPTAVLQKTDRTQMRGLSTEIWWLVL